MPLLPASWTLGFSGILLFAPPLFAAPEEKPAVTTTITTVDTTAEKALSVIRVNVTNQAWDFTRPWGKRPPYTRRAIGTVLSGNRVLVTAELVANANYVEFEKAEGGAKTPATVDVVDYEANLALLKTDDAEFLKGIKPINIASAVVGDVLSVWQLESNGNLLVTKGPMTTAEVTRYPVDETPLLIYRLTAPLQIRDASFTLPVVKNDDLVGIIMRFDKSTNNADLIPAPVILHFLKDAANPPYQGFPRSGVAPAMTRDPQFRRFLGLNASTPGGMYITQVAPDGPAALGGIQAGDVILKVDGKAVDQDGNYRDSEYGKIAIAHFLSSKHFVGDKVPVSIFRNGETKDLELTLTHRPASSFNIEPYVIDRAPKFFVLGGLVLEELSRQYLREWGPEWPKKAPEQFVYLDRQQADLFSDPKKKVVILNRVLPSDATVGYEELSQLIVTKINGLEINGLSDIPEALEKATNGLHKVEFDSEPTVIYLDASQIRAEENAFMRKYRLPVLQRLK